MNENVIEIEAEVIETDISLADKVKPLLERVLDNVDEDARRIVETYSLIIEPETDEDYKQLKRTRAALNKDLKRLEDERKRIKAPFAQAVKQIDGEFKTVLQEAKELEATYKKNASTYEENKRLERYGLLLTNFNEIYSDISALVDFELLDGSHTSGASSWYVSSVGDVKALDMLASDCSEIRRDVSTIDALPGLNEDDRLQLKSDYYSTLNLNDAITRSNERITARKREEARRAEIKAQEEERFQLMQEEAKAREEAREEPEECFEEKPASYEIKVEMKSDDLEALVSFLKSRGLHGHIKKLTK